MKPIISMEEAREILGRDASRVSDVEIEELLTALDLLAKDALEEAQQQIRMKNDAEDMANLIYDIYKDKVHKKMTVPKPNEE